ncbi:MAG: hypothetical protein L0H00_10475 [Micrococcales bacterium]|nr:hypothetical protein [Micrococcales bacterium]
MASFAAEFLVKTCGVDPWHLFATFPDDRVPSGAMESTRVLAALLDAPLCLVLASPNYFARPACLVELGASISSRGVVHYLTIGDLKPVDMPKECAWLPWRPAASSEVLKRIKADIDASHDIDSAPHLCADSKWVTDFKVEVGPALKAELIESRPFYFDAGRKGAAFGLHVWRTPGGEVVPILYAAPDQISVMNADSLVGYVQKKYQAVRLYALWPEGDADMGVCRHEVGGGTFVHVEQELADMGIPVLTVGKTGSTSIREASNYFEPPWFARVEMHQSEG